MVLAGKGLRAGAWRMGNGLRIHRHRRGRPSRRSVLDSARFLSAPCRIGSADVNGASPLEGVAARMRRYELMLVLRPDVPDDRSQAVIDRTTRQITAGGGQIVKVAPWGRRRLAYPIDRYREGSYHIVLFAGARPTPSPSWSTACSSPRRSSATSSPATSGPSRPRAARTASDVDETDDTDLPSGIDEEDEDDGRERIDESESEAAPAAID